MQRGQRLSFGPYQIDVRDERMRRDDQFVPVTRKAFAVLCALLNRAGQLITKEDLFREVWSGTVVTDAALTRCIRELRVALRDDAGSPRYIETVHGRGFRFIAPVISSDTAGTTHSKSANRVVGRNAELQQLHRALDIAQAGERQVVFVTGEPGIGKTATVEAFLGELAGEGDIWVAQGRCIEQYGAAEAYLPMLEALERLGQLLGGGELSAVLQQYAPTWLVQLPALTDVREREQLQRQTAGTTRQRMLREITQALEALAAQRSVIVWLEDLHGAIIRPWIWCRLSRPGGIRRGSC
jgi:DNA-binding winged helix-turn-helix (wHTH) protein